ncbi:hypothetical protein D9M68_963780 [compost metagenome]
MARTVDMRLKHGSFFFQLTVAREGKYLVAATICKNRFVPAVEFMQTACSLDNICAWSQVQVVCITQDNLGLNIIQQLILHHRLYTAGCTYRHKDRRFDHTMIGMQQARTGTCIGTNGL